MPDNFTRDLRGVLSRIKCWPYNIEFMQSPMFAGYEIRVWLDTRDASGQPTTMYCRHMVGYDALMQREIRPVLEAAVKAALHKLAIDHVDAHLRFE